MDDLINTLRASTSPSATPDERQAGAAACRALLAAFETNTGEPIGATATETSVTAGVAPPSQTAAPAATNAAPSPNASLPVDATTLAAIIAPLRGLPPEQLLDLVIARVRAALPAAAVPPPVQPLRFHVVPIPPQLRDGKRPGTK